MSQYNSSSAEELFPLESPPEQNRIPQQRYHVVERKAPEKHIPKVVTFRNIVAFFAIVAVICVMLYNQARLNEINGEISNVNGNILQLQSEYVRMQSSLESSLSLGSVARKAEQELGLQRLDQYQVEYVYIYENDRVEYFDDAEPESISEEFETFVAKVGNFAKGLFGK